MEELNSGEVALLVNAARQAAERSSIRDVARQSGMSHGGLHNLLLGKNIRVNGATLRKLRSWYLREWTSGGGGLSPETAAYLMEQVLAPIPAGARVNATRDLVRFLERTYDSYSAPRPVWLGAVGSPS